MNTKTRLACAIRRVLFPSRKHVVKLLHLDNVFQEPSLFADRQRHSYLPLVSRTGRHYGLCAALLTDFYFYASATNGCVGGIMFLGRPSVSTFVRACMHPEQGC